MKTFSHLHIKGFSECHVQGIAVDKKREYMYFSFTTSLIKTDLKGNLIGSVNGIVGHLGCIAYNFEDGKIYGSLEYKNDSIGKGILKAENCDITFDDAFYVVCFDADKITRPDMDAEKDGIMTAVWLKDVVDDFSCDGHRYGCSGIDGITFAPKPGEKSGNFLYVAYGIYRDNKRRDNDHQIILCYDTENLMKYSKSLNQYSLHNNGPQKADNRYFVYTGNTSYGIQNLEYDKEHNCLFAAVYKGRKWRFPNYSMYAVDMSEKSEIKKLKGIKETGEWLSLKRLPFFKYKGKISGCNFPYGTTGMISLGDGKFLFSQEFRNEGGHGTDVYSYVLYPDKGFVRSEIHL